MNSQYHLFDNGIDRSKAVGVVFYFDGDGQYYAQRPTSAVIKNMAARAAAKNMILVVPVTPTADRTWYSRADANGEWFRSLASKVIAEQRIDNTRIQLAGYSGGAEFIALEVLSDRAGWIRGGGSTMIGGGGVYNGRLQSTPDAALKATDPTWYVGSNDSFGATQPSNWSALDSAGKGAAAYRTAGFTKADRVVMPGLHHTNYDLADIVGDDIDRLYPTSGSPAPAPVAPAPAPVPVTPAPSGDMVVGGYQLKGSIGSHWASLGGTSWGTPVSAEWASGYGSVYQRFVGTDGKDKAIYWSSSTGTHVVNYGGSIGQKFAEAGYAGTYGPPSTDEQSITGGAYQVFSAAGQTTKVLWSSSTGSKAVKEFGAIGKRWTALGSERGLGFPSTDEYRTSSGWAQQFTGGRIEYNTRTKDTSVIRS
ncbi:LGFP repeat-containing protein [Kocuria sp. CPCC 205300]|uniref:LGFP repeat-containing protein n=1 Tax=Kocuria sabuli TaxID=3071448 RepID=UPI0036DBC30B